MLSILATVSVNAFLIFGSLLNVACEILSKRIWCLITTAVAPLGVLASHPLMGFLSVFKRPAMHVTAVQPLALADVHAVHVPPVTEAHPASHPSP